ncbi:hypothetical protein L209DRAFT_751576 [Thermothelomyces heterothallicus CBS 203.75]
MVYEHISVASGALVGQSICLYPTITFVGLRITITIMYRSITGLNSSMEIKVPK